MANISFLVGGTKCSLLILVVIGLSILPAAWCQYCNTVNGTFIRISIILDKKRNENTYLGACLWTEVQRGRREE